MAQICGIVILITLMVLYLIQKKLYLRSERTFFGMLLLMLVTHCLDIFSLWAIENASTLPDWFVITACKVYLISLVMCITGTVIYICGDIFRKQKDYYKKAISFIIPTAIGIIFIAALPLYIYHDSIVAYTYGSSAIATYVTAFFYICTILTLICIYRKQINRDRRFATFVWMALWTIAALIQFFVPSLLLVSFAGSIGMMILYITLEDPGMNINKQTGLFNQNAFMEYIRQSFDTNTSVALIQISIDGYSKEMYKEFSWENAENLLGTGGRALVFRRSEDELVLVFDYAEEALEWEKSFDEKISHSDNSDYIRLRYAFRTVIADSLQLSSSDELIHFLKYSANIQYADSKKGKHTRVIADSETLLSMRRERDVEQLIEDAIESDRVEVYYQPIFSTDKQKFTSAEALIRIRDGDGKIVSPGVFIPVAERNGKILDLGRIVLENVCRFIKEENPTGYGIEYIEVNLSVAQCARESLAADCIDIIDKYSIASDRINFEITESASLNSKDIFMKNLERLMDYGISFSLDDFGTGQSNLNYIVDMPVDIVKFDRDMINAFFANTKARYVMEAAIQMIRGLGLKIVAEGIETESQYLKMKEMGINYIQGYFFSKPLSEKEFKIFISENNCKVF